ncbi:hypothetical protein [Nostoc sp. UHCC 0870]
MPSNEVKGQNSRVFLPLHPYTPTPLHPHKTNAGFNQVGFG